MWPGRKVNFTKEYDLGADHRHHCLYKDLYADRIHRVAVARPSHFPYGVDLSILTRVLSLHSQINQKISEGDSFFTWFYSTPTLSILTLSFSLTQTCPNQSFALTQTPSKVIQPTWVSSFFAISAIATLAITVILASIAFHLIITSQCECYDIFFTATLAFVLAVLLLWYVHFEIVSRRTFLESFWNFLGIYWRKCRYAKLVQRARTFATKYVQEQCVMMQSVQNEIDVE